MGIALKAASDGRMLLLADSVARFWVLPFILATFCFGAVCLCCMIGDPTLVLKSATGEKLGVVNTQVRLPKSEGYCVYVIHATHPDVLFDSILLISSRQYFLAHCDA